MKKKPSFYYLKNSKGEYDGLWSLAIYSFVFIMVVTIVQIAVSIIQWESYYSVIQRLDNLLARSVKPPQSSLKDIASWVSAFGGLCLGPIIAGYVARRNEVMRPDESIALEKEKSNKAEKEDDGH
jgi:hypothetical protein